MLYSVTGCIFFSKELAIRCIICNSFERTLFFWRRFPYFLIFESKIVSKGIEVHQAESYSPPSLSSPVGNRRRKSTPPRRCAPVNRTSKAALRSSLSGSGSAGARLHPLTRRRLFTASGDCASSRVASTSATVESTEVDLDALTSQDSPLVVEVVTTTQSKGLTEAEVDKGGLATETNSTIQAVSFDKVIENGNGKGTSNEDVAGGSQELDDVEVIIVSDTEAEQLNVQVRKYIGTASIRKRRFKVFCCSSVIG